MTELPFDPNEKRTELQEVTAATSDHAEIAGLGGGFRPDTPLISGA